MQARRRPLHYALGSISWARMLQALYEVIDMNPKERVELVGRLGAVLEQLEGEAISIQEMISHDYENRELDRHCTIQTCRGKLRQSGEFKH